MKFLIPAFIAIFSVFNAITSGNITTEYDTLIITDENYKQAIWEYPNIFFMFYHPDCDWSLEALPIFDEAANKMKATNCPVKFAKVDVSTANGLKHRYHIRGYPKFKLYKDKYVYEFNGARDADNFVNWVKKAMIENPTDIKFENETAIVNDGNFKEVDQIYSNIFFMFYSPSCVYSSRALPIFDEAATKMKATNCPVKFAKVDVTFAQKLQHQFNIPGYPTFILKSFNKMILYESTRKRTVDEFINWINNKTNEQLANVKPNAE